MNIEDALAGAEVWVNNKSWFPDEPRKTKILRVIGKNLVSVYRSEEFGGYSDDYNAEQYRVSIYDLELLPPSIKHIKLYKQSCKRCKHPARKIADTLFCSNTKCPENGKIRQRFTSAVLKKPFRIRLDVGGYVVCLQCALRINKVQYPDALENISQHMQDTFPKLLTPHYYRISCTFDHMDWFEFKNNDLVYIDQKTFRYVVPLGSISGSFVENNPHS